MVQKHYEDSVFKMFNKSHMFVRKAQRVQDT